MPLGNGDTPYSTRPGRTQSPRVSGQASNAAELAMLRAPARPAVAAAKDCSCDAVIGIAPVVGAREVRHQASGRRRRCRCAAADRRPRANCSRRKPSRFMPVSTLIQAETTSEPARASSISSCSKLCTIRSKRCCAAAASCAVLNTPSSSRMRLVRPAARSARPSSRRATAKPSVWRQRLGGGHQPVAVGVRLDHRHDARRRRGGAHAVEVVAQRRGVDDRADQWFHAGDSAAQPP